jgi:hypothetical protein
LVVLVVVDDAEGRVVAVGVALGLGPDVTELAPSPESPPPDGGTVAPGPPDDVIDEAGPGVSEVPPDDLSGSVVGTGDDELLELTPDPVSPDWVTTGLEGATTVPSSGAVERGADVVVDDVPPVDSCTSWGSATRAELSDPCAADTMATVKRIAATPGSAHQGILIGRSPWDPWRPCGNAELEKSRHPSSPNAAVLWVHAPSGTPSARYVLRSTVFSTTTAPFGQAAAARRARLALRRSCGVPSTTRPYPHRSSSTPSEYKSAQMA